MLAAARLVLQVRKLKNRNSARHAGGFRAKLREPSLGEGLGGLFGANGRLTLFAVPMGALAAKHLKSSQVRRPVPAW
jgi:hypothetical protein